MDALTRWKTIATIAVAFSAGNLFATACQNGGGGKANAEVSAADLASLATALVATEAEVASLKCFIGHMTDDQYWNGYATNDERHPGSWGTSCYGESDDQGCDGDIGWGQGPNSDAMKAYEDCF